MVGKGRDGSFAVRLILAFGKADKNITSRISGQGF
jgi:hypothetical protein